MRYLSTEELDEIVLAGGNFHQEVAAKMFDVTCEQVTREQYQTAKRETFVYLYGSKAPTIMIPTNPIVYRASLRRAMAKHNFTVEQMAEKLGKTPEWLRQKLEE